MALSRFCLDTSAYSHFQRGEPRVVEQIDRAEWLGVPTVVLGELWTGFLLGGNRETNTAELDAFLGNAVVEVLPIEREVALRRHRVLRRCRPRCSRWQIRSGPSSVSLIIVGRPAGAISNQAPKNIQA